MTVRAETRPPVSSALVTTIEPSAETSAIGKPIRARPSHVLVAGIGEVAARQLGAALEQVAGERPGGEARPVVGGPAELVDQRPEDERRIGTAPEDHDLGTARERLGDRIRTEIDVRRDDRLVRDRDALDDRPRPDLGVVDVGQQVVALDDGDAEVGQAELVGEAEHHVRRGARVGRAEVGDDPDPASRQSAQDRPQERGRRRA